ncbi:MAG: AraC family transcriptional regulator ligand-binding domain-containing protein [Armatimonadota bacterium]
MGLAEALREAGLSPVEVLATAGLPSRLLDTPGQRVAVPQYFALWRAIQVLSTYKRLLSPEDLVVRVDDAAKQVVLTYEWPPYETSLPQVLVDTELAFIVEMCRRGTRCADLTPREVHLHASALEEGADHAAFFRCPIRLGAVKNAIVFAAEDTAKPFVTFNPQLLNALVPYLQANTPPFPTLVVARIRSVIAQRLRGQRPTARTVARELAMSMRAMQRLLKDNGTSFRQVLDAVRNEHARGYLSSTSFGDGEVSFLLGFEDPNSFYRAFRSWNGMSPSEFRRCPDVRH